MRRESLMLSDMAMVLLRQYDELTQQYQEIRDTLSPYSPNASEDARLLWDHWRWQQDHIPRIERLQQDLLEEMNLLWRNQDLNLIRHLDWHLVLDSEFLTWAEESQVLTWLSDGRQYQDAWIKIGGVLAQFFRRLSKIYRQDVAVRSGAPLLFEEIAYVDDP